MSMVKQVLAAELAHALEECFNQCSVLVVLHCASVSQGFSGCLVLSILASFTGAPVDKADTEWH